MNFRPQRREELDLNITPLVDVVFLLLIFFMVSTTFDRQSEISINLPRASDAMPDVDTETITVSIDGQGRIFVNDEPLLNTRLNTIREAIRVATTDLVDPVIVINADAEATHQIVVKVMDAARQLALGKVTFATQVYDESEY